MHHQRLLKFVGNSTGNDTKRQTQEYMAGRLRQEVIDVSEEIVVELGEAARCLVKGAVTLDEFQRCARQFPSKEPIIDQCANDITEIAVIQRDIATQ